MSGCACSLMLDIFPEIVNVDYLRCASTAEEPRDHVPHPRHALKTTARRPEERDLRPGTLQRLSSIGRITRPEGSCNAHLQSGAELRRGQPLQGDGRTAACGIESGDDVENVDREAQPRGVARTGESSSQRGLGFSGIAGLPP